MMKDMRKRWAIVDLDGTICDCSHRVDLARLAKAETDPTERARKWDEFHAKHPNDLAHEAEVLLLQCWLVAGGNIVYLTGRTDKYRVSTQRWLKRYDLPQTPLIMRDAGNYAGTVDYKRQKLDHIRTHMMKKGDIVAFVLEDQDPLVAMWRGLGITCLQPRPSAWSDAK